MINFSLFGSVDAKTIILFVVLGLLLVALFVLPMFTNKKRQKEAQAMYDSIRVGTKIKTVGGIVGTIVEINTINAVDKEFTLETGKEGSKCTMVFDMKAIYQVMGQTATTTTTETTEVPSNDIPDKK